MKNSMHKLNKNINLYYVGNLKSSLKMKFST